MPVSFSEVWLVFFVSILCICNISCYSSYEYLAVVYVNIVRIRYSNLVSYINSVS